MYDLIIGSLLIFSWLNCFLFALEIAAFVYYFRKYGADSFILKATVGTCVLLDTLCTVANNLGVYRYTITNWGNVEYLSQQEWQIPLYLICTGIVAAIVQSFLILRYKSLSGNLLACLPMFLLVVASLAGSFATAIMIILASSLNNRGDLKIPVIVWFVLSAVLDCSISGLLIYCLRSGQSKVKFRATQIDRLSSVALQTGSMTSIVAIIILIVFLENPEGNVATGFGQCLGRLYTISMLWNLIIRASVATKTSTPSIETGDLPINDGTGSTSDDEKTKDNSSISKQ